LAPGKTLTLIADPIPAPARTWNNDSGSCSGLKCKLRQESTPALLLLRSPVTLMQPWVKPYVGPECWRQKLRLVRH